MPPKRSDAEIPREIPPEAIQPSADTQPKPQPSATDRLLARSKKREGVARQIEYTRKTIDDDLNAYAAQREKLDLAPSETPPPGIQQNIDRAESLDKQKADLAPTEKSRLETAISLIKPMNDGGVVEKVTRLFPDPKDNPTAPHYLVVDHPKLTLFGVSHGKNPESKTIQKLYETIPAVADMPDNLVFMVEGQHGGINRDQVLEKMKNVKSRDKAVETYGENGAAFWAVKEANDAGKTIELTSPEAPDAGIIAELVAKNRDREDIALYLTIRQFTSDIGQADKNVSPHDRLAKLVRDFNHIQQTTGVEWMRVRESDAEIEKMMGDKEPPEIFDGWLQKQAAEFLTGMNARLSTTKMTENAIVPDVEALMNADVERISMKDINGLHDPMDRENRGSVINAISTEWNGARDRFLVERIAKAIDDGKKPFVIFGGSHVASIEGTVDTLLTDRNE